MFSLFLAKRFFSKEQESSEGNRRASAPAIRIATAGIAVAVAVMIISVCFVKGFQREVSEKLIGLASHIEIQHPKFFNSPESYPVITDASLLQQLKQVPDVGHVQRVSHKLGIFKTPDDFSGIALKGVGQDYRLDFMQKHLVTGSIPNFRDDRPSNQIIISQTLAKRLGLKVGDKVYSYFFAETIKQRRFTIAGIYNTYLPQFDKTLVMTDIYTVNKLNSWSSNQSSGVEIQLKDARNLPAAERAVARIAANKSKQTGTDYAVLGLHSNPRTASMLSWLELLDANIMVILIIVIGVAGFTMISGLLILILERTTTIGVLKALGASNTRIRHTFLWFAAFIIGRGLLIGNAIGLSLMFIQQHFELIKLNPETYYVDSVPVELDWTWILGINAISLVVNIIALILPSFLVSQVQPAKAIQFD